MENAIGIRPAVEADLPAILDIYNDAVRNTTAIWNETLVDLPNRREWFADRMSKNHPVLVAERQGEVVGYATYGVWRVIEGFRQTMEHSVYVRSDRKGGGIGSALMQALISEARARHIHVLVACIEAENLGSIKLHEKLGFKTVGRFGQVGQKFGRWLDLLCMELPLQEASKPPVTAQVLD
ncbi:GNAT family N-acetyltransferase (plasmid) [Rhizobium sp. CB3060]|uniref:GNAT family N-acetyltransferase n=1 Tax=Rhizobium sp. CB3060 TaxID=3138255 RepID=UPI0021A3DB36|nr:GNAT family N-acetyltransferase [Rhizobium tropici]UWU25667.1 GNAT family N-acetyltransferase [Rhizobium tropici]